jgi:hypothetical protein
VLADRKALRRACSPIYWAFSVSTTTRRRESRPARALLELLPKVTVDAMGAHDYAWNGTTFGGKTLPREIRRLPAHAEITFDSELGSISATRKLEPYIEEHAERLRRLFADLAGALGEHLHVSMILVSFLLAQGPPVCGLASSCTGKTTTSMSRPRGPIAEGEQLTLEVIDKGRIVRGGRRCL